MTFGKQTIRALLAGLLLLTATAGFPATVTHTVRNDDTLWRIARQYGTSFPYLIDDNPYLASKIYGISIVPTWYLVDGNLKVIATGEAWVKKEYVDLATLLAEKTGAEILGLFNPEENVLELKPG